MAKRENDFLPIDELMKSFIKENNLSKGMLKMNIREVWAKLMGNGVVAYTESVTLQNKTLIVKLSSSVLREELSYGKEKIINMLNDELGKELITKLMLV